MNKVYIEHTLPLPKDDELPYVEPLFFDRLFMMFSVEDIVAMYITLLFE